VPQANIKIRNGTTLSAVAVSVILVASPGKFVRLAIPPHMIAVKLALVSTAGLWGRLP